MRRRRFADDVQREPVKLPSGKAGFSGHYVHSLPAVSRVQSSAQPPGCFRISIYTSCLHFAFSTSAFLLSTFTSVLIFPAFFAALSEL
jgi:hypothetical protein